MQPVPRPLASVSLGGSLRASRAALLARPRGPLAAVDLADGRALMLEDLGAGWAPCGIVEPPLPAPGELTAVLSAPVRRRRRLALALALAGVLGASAVGLVTGFSRAPPPAVAQPLAAPPAARPPLPAVAAARPRGGRAAAIAREKAPSDRHSRPPPPPAPPARAVGARRTAPEPPRLPELPSVPAL